MRATCRLNRAAFFLCTVVANNVGIDVVETPNGMACSGGMATSDPLCTEQFKNLDIAALKVVPEPGYAFTDWTVNGAPAKQTDSLLVLITGTGLAGKSGVLPGGTATCQANCERQTVYLTFDDGPVPGTDDIIRILQTENVVGSFLMVGVHVSSAQREGWVRDAHTYFKIGNHSYSHPWRHSDLQIYYEETETAAQTVFEDFQHNDTVLSSVIGMAQQFTLSRFPTKNTWRISGITRTDTSGGQYPPGAMAANLLQSNGYQIYGWDPDALWEDQGDGTGCAIPIQSPNDMAKIVQGLFQKGSIKPNKVVVLMHDRMFRQSCQTDGKLQEFIRILKNPPYGYV